MKMLSALQRTVENEGRKAIRAVEWFPWMREAKPRVAHVNPRGAQHPESDRNAFPQPSAKLLRTDGLGGKFMEGFIVPYTGLTVRIEWVEARRPDCKTKVFPKTS